MPVDPNTPTPPNQPPPAVPGQQPNPQDPANNPAEGETSATWESWIAAQPEPARALYETHTQGLRSALESERTQRKTFETQLRDQAKKLEAGSEAQTRLTEMADELERANRRADFYESAAKPDVGVTDVVGAWAIINAMPEDYLDRKGSVNFALLKQRHPGLFGRPPAVPRGNAGSGAGQGDGGGKNDMNAYIRRQAGRS
jgi:hypothetical protein